MAGKPQLASILGLVYNFREKGFKNTMAETLYGSAFQRMIATILVPCGFDAIIKK